MPLLLPLLPLIAQVGPFTAPGTNGTPFEQAMPRKKAQAQAVAQPVAPDAAPPSRLQGCLDTADDDAENGSDAAEAWLKTAKGAEVAEAQLCRGVAYSHSEDWREAEQAFVAGREAAGADRLMRARLGAMAGNAALAGGAPDRAMAALDGARTDVKGLSDAALETTIALDRARALVALKREGEAEASLAEARTASPTSAEAWLLSATLSRRMGKLGQAQQQIEQAAQIMPVDPDIGLEAGVIAMLAGRDAAARRSWESVLKAGPDSPAAATAKGYLAQLGPATAAEQAADRAAAQATANAAAKAGGPAGIIPQGR